MKKFIIGIDVSKQKLDYCLLDSGSILKEIQGKNTLSGIKATLGTLVKEYGIEEDHVLICAEYTGQYTYPLCCISEEMGFDLWLENPEQIKYRSGVQRGKNDKIDARRIAYYGYGFKEEARLFCMPEKSIRSLRQLIPERDMYVCDRSKYQGQLTDQKTFMSKEDYQNKSKRLKSLIKTLDHMIDEIEYRIQNLISTDDFLSHQHKLLCSIDGIGDKTAVKMIAETNGFRDFDDPRKFCCHAGVAPFTYQSGSSRHSRSRVSHRADKSIKVLLHLAALCAATKMKGELHVYYQRKVSEGKNKMSVLNAVRAKLVHRMFAVIRENKLYEKNYQNHLAFP